MAKKRRKKNQGENQEISQEEIVRAIHIILNQPFWIPGLDVNSFYSRLHDDHDGTFQGSLTVGFSSDADAWVSIDGVPSGSSLRFRNAFIGGGQSERVRTALLILALAIKLDNEERPQERPKGKEDKQELTIM